jgi:DNA-binding transcriptional regulator/RsmH inhibitor MraZ
VARPVPRAALSLLREWDGERPVSQWQHWIVAVEPTGRIMLPSGARQVLGSDSCVQAVTREGILVLHQRDGGACLAIDRRGRLILPAWLRTPARSSASVLVAARAVDTPSVVVAPTDVLERIVSHVAEVM